MDRENAKILAPIIKAFAEGKTIQFRVTPTDTWKDLIATNINFNYPPNDFRIKPENTDEEIEELKKAYAAGKKIQFYTKLFGGWRDAGSPAWCPYTKYRLAPGQEETPLCQTCVRGENHGKTCFVDSHVIKCSSHKPLSHEDILRGWFRYIKDGDVEGHSWVRVLSYCRGKYTLEGYGRHTYDELCSKFEWRESPEEYTL